jgi:hypothetical protein
MKKILILTVVLLSVISGTSLCQQQIIEAIDTPTAASMDLGTYAVTVRLYERGSILTRLYYGIIMRNLTLGLSFDAESVIGSEDIKPRRPYLYIKIPLYIGDMTWPAIGLGFDEQGLGLYDEDSEQYQVPPVGFFLVFTKMGIISGLNISVGANAYYSFINDADEKIYGFCNADFMIGPEFMLLAEVKEITAWDSYFNVGAKYFLNPELDFEFSVLDVGGRQLAQRILRITYTGEF